jgi:cytoskeletal protein CcmA (bactofilin family)
LRRKDLAGGMINPVVRGLGHRSPPSTMPIRQLSSFMEKQDPDQQAEYRRRQNRGGTDPFGITFAVAAGTIKCTDYRRFRRDSGFGLRPLETTVRRAVSKVTDSISIHWPVLTSIGLLPPPPSTTQRPGFSTTVLHMIPSNSCLNQHMVTTASPDESRDSYMLPR